MDATTRAIGNDNELLWHLPDDLAYFKKHTKGSPVIMGRATFESIGKILPGRTNIILTRNHDWHHDGVVIAHDKEEALRAATENNDSGTIWIIGGAQIYELFMSDADQLYLTLVNTPADENRDIHDDVFFPEYTDHFSTEIFSQSHQERGMSYRWIVLEK